jgi:hypothetical protein
MARGLNDRVKAPSVVSVPIRTSLWQLSCLMSALVSPLLLAAGCSSEKRLNRRRRMSHR